MISKFGILVIAMLACSANALPPCTCTRNYAPVCGTDGHTYSNECMMECAQQTKARDGPCKVTAPVNCICTLEYNPTCGSDGQTHPNPCSARCSGGGVAHFGPCQSEAVQPKQPPCTCNKMKKPVCGSDGRTYSNDCLLNCATIENSRLSIAHFGPCTAGEGIHVVDNVQPESVHVVDNVQPESSHVVDDFKVEPVKVAPNWNACTCTRNLNPVCGADGVTYSNECMLRCAGAEKAKEGSCDGGLEREHQVVVEE